MFHVAGGPCSSESMQEDGCDSNRALAFRLPSLSHLPTGLKVVAVGGISGGCEIGNRKHGWALLNVSVMRG